MSGKIPEVDAYIEAQEPDRREALGTLRELVHRTVPGVGESMRYRMPTFSTSDVVCALASQKHHMGLYICSDVLETYRDRLDEVDMGKGCIRFRRLGQLPIETVVEILESAAETPGFHHP